MGVLDKFSCKGKKAFITGSARGIGKAAAIALSDAGADVAIIDLKLEEAQAAADEITKLTGGKTIAIAADISKPSDVDAMIKTILDEFGTIDIAFNNAGICNADAPAEEMKYEDFRQILDVNLTGVFLCSQAAGKVMLKQGSGSIINMASMSAHIVNVPQKTSHYAATKAGVIALSKNMAAEWAARGVRVNTISPGYHMTELAKQWTDMHPIWQPRIPMDRFGDPAGIGELVVFLGSGAANYITGADIVIDGGYTLW